MADNISLHGKVSVVAGFPTIGKTTAAKFMDDFSNVMVVDVETSDFKRMMDESELPNWERYYASSIKCLINDLTDKLTNNPDMSYVILTSSHDTVRKAFDELGIQYYYVFPDKNTMKGAADIAYDRWQRKLAEDPDPAGGPERAYKFLSDYYNSGKYEELYALEDTETCTHVAIDVYLASWIMDHLVKTKPVPEETS